MVCQPPPCMTQAEFIKEREVINIVSNGGLMFFECLRVEDEPTVTICLNEFVEIFLKCSDNILTGIFDALSLE
jgi:hypothetical protein